MTPHQAVLCKRTLVPTLLSAMLLTGWGCSGTKSSTSPKVDSRTRAADSFDGGTYCVQTLVEGPPVPIPLHFSNKEIQTDGSWKDFESDLTSDAFDVTYHDHRPATEYDRPAKTPAAAVGGMHTPAVVTTVADGFTDILQTNHYSRLDNHDWAMGYTAVAQGGTPWSLFLNKPVVTSSGNETIGGYETTRYSIDTTHQSQAEKSVLLMIAKLKDYRISGTAWVARESRCILQYQIDYEEDGQDGTIRKTRYEGRVTKR